MRFLPREWAAIARAIAERLAAAGHRSWIVGGAVRDLALGAVPEDVDMATSAPPDDIERLFERTFAVGKAFGTVVVQLSGHDVQVTTLRTEESYSDRRRPDRVAWGTNVEQDAARRDFTCNALYLDPLRDELADPTGGLADLERGILRCVGDPAERFREDGLRLVRLARFAAALDFEVDPAALAAARGRLDALAGVSPERVAEELRCILGRPRAARALRLLEELGVLGRLFPAFAGLPGQPEDRWRALDALEPVAGFEEGLALLFEPAPSGSVRGGPDLERAEGLLDSLRLSREERRTVGELWRLQGDARLTLAEDHPSRARRIRLARDPLWPRAERLLRAWQSAMGESTSSLDELCTFAASLSASELHPQPLVRSSDLADAGVPRGPRWGELLTQAEELQLEGLHTSREQALAWLHAQA